MKAQIYVSSRNSAQHAIDAIKDAYASGSPHLVLVMPPEPQASSKQKQKAMTIISKIAQETGETDVRQTKHIMLNDMGWFDEQVELQSPVPLGLTDLNKAELSFLIDRLEQFCAEQGWAI